MSFCSPRDSTQRLFTVCILDFVCVRTAHWAVFVWDYVTRYRNKFRDVYEILDTTGWLIRLWHVSYFQHACKSLLRRDIVWIFRPWCAGTCTIAHAPLDALVTSRRLNRSASNCLIIIYSFRPGHAINARLYSERENTLKTFKRNCDVRLFVKRIFRTVRV